MAEWRGMKVKLDSPSRIQKGEPGYGRKKFKVFVMSGGKVKKIMFGDPNMEIRKDNPKARASFRARHKCSTAKDKTTARYWSCKMWWVMPFVKVGPNKYKSPSGRIYTEKQVKAYYATRGFKKT